MDDEGDTGSLLPPGVGPSNRFDFLKRRTEPLWVIALIICLPLIAVLVIFIARAIGL